MITLTRTRAVILLCLVAWASMYGQQALNVGITVISGIGWLNVNTTSSVVAGTTAPAEVEVVGGKTNDGTPQYQMMPLGTAGRAVIVEQFTAGGNPCVNPNVTMNSTTVATSGTTAVQVIAASGSTAIHICTMYVMGVSGTSPTFSLVYGTSTNCGTGQTVILAAFATAAASLFSFNGQPVFKTPASQAVCYLDAGTTPVQRLVINYVQQ